MNTSDRRRRTSGFTLIELMVAMVITALIVGILISITSLAMDSWQRSRSEVRAARQAKAMLDVMAKDLESFVSRPSNTYEWLYAKTTTTLPGPTSIQSSSASDLIFCTSATDRYNGQVNTASDKGGDVSCVAYKLDYQDPIDGTANVNLATFTLYRKLVNPDEVYKNILGQTDLNAAFSSYQSSLTSTENFVCENIFQFDITFHVNTVDSKGVVTSNAVPLGKGSPLISELHIKGNAVSSDSKGTAMTLNGQAVTGVTAVSISTTVLSDFAIDQMRKRKFANADDKAKFITKYGFHYVKNVRLPGA